jgi:hypothetical protein
MHETFLDLLSDPAHWLFELFLMALFDGVIGIILWPPLRRTFARWRDKETDKIQAHHQFDHWRLENLDRIVQGQQERVKALEERVDALSPYRSR